MNLFNRFLNSLNYNTIVSIQQECSNKSVRNNISLYITFRKNKKNF